jgi:hypothetical protein
MFGKQTEMFVKQTKMFALQTEMFVQQTEMFGEQTGLFVLRERLFGEQTRRRFKRASMFGAQTRPFKLPAPSKRGEFCERPKAGHWTLRFEDVNRVTVP